MLKLLRMGDTNIFAIVDEEKFKSDMEVEGYTQIKRHAIMEPVKNFKVQNEVWFAEVQKLRDEKRAELYDCSYPEEITSISLRSIILCYFKEMETCCYISVTRIRELITFIWNRLEFWQLTAVYSIACNSSKEDVESKVSDNNDIFGMDEDGFVNMKASYEEICNCHEIRLLDETIAEIIGEFVKKYKD